MAAKSTTFTFKLGDPIWNKRFPYIVGIVISTGYIGPWPAYKVRQHDGCVGAVFADEARLAA